MGSDLIVGDYGNQSIGQGLSIGGDDASQLQMNFTFLATALSLQFGNDDPAYTLAGDVGVLLGFKGGVQVVSSVVTMNRDDVMNQSISISGSFDTAYFYYGRPGAVGTNPSPIALIEIVDNINYTVPEPASLGAMTLVGVGLMRRRMRVG